MASKLDAYAEDILAAEKSDKDIAQEAGVTTGAVRAYRNRMKRNGANSAVASAISDAAKPAPEPTPKKKAKPVEKPETPTTEPVEKVCPKCGVKAEGPDEIQELFGYRQVSAGKGKGKKKIPQSQCRVCRAASTKASKAKRAAEKKKNDE